MARKRVGTKAKVLEADANEYGAFGRILVAGTEHKVGFYRPRRHGYNHYDSGWSLDNHGDSDNHLFWQWFIENDLEPTDCEFRSLILSDKDEAKIEAALLDYEAQEKAYREREVAKIEAAQLNYVAEEKAYLEWEEKFLKEE